MKDNWKYILFEDCLQKVKYTNKVFSSDYLKKGTYPIISQEEAFVSGYWNNEDDVFRVQKPVVIFGDHTRVLKYVDFDFVIGADGVKILLPKDALNTKFLKYYLYWYNIPNLGYSRHYKLLKELYIPVPTLSIQEAIVAELDKLNEILTKKHEQLKELDRLGQAVFYDMFGDPDNNEKKWLIQRFGDIASVIGGFAFKSDSFNIKGIPVLKIGNINTGIFKQDNLCFYAYDSKLCKYEVYPNDLVISLTGTVGKGDYGNVCILPDTYKCYYLNQRNAKLETYGLYQNMFLKYLLSDKKIKSFLTRNCRGVRQANILNKDIENLKLILPSLDIQAIFVEKVVSLENQKQKIKQSIVEVQQLLDYTMNKYFG
ncbi:restriction endonuclease subunit S [Parabacteroides sp. AF14-59]|uniref:restriction endonuclease subunit S n=2 Tax=Parabacteroides TaxID=375288 RepID=UPI0018F49869|nr:restriction endonuclease subunit S [Parabacteroides sp. AF14-59]